MEQFHRDVISGRRPGVVSLALCTACWFSQWPYRAGMAVRNLAYDWEFLESHSAGVPVVSVGNLTTGGTGKTPVVAFLANWFREAECRVGLLSRGYRSLGTDGNDEKLVLDRLCPGIPHWQDRDRRSSAEKAVRESGCNLLILDDAFQHRRLRRDFDIVLIDATAPWGFGHCLPRGLLREPVSAVRRADLVLVTRADLVPPETLTAIRTELARHDQVAGVIEVAFRPTTLINSLGEQRPVSELVTARSRCVTFCGIGNPESFEQSLRRQNIEVVAARTFPDHHHFTEADVADLTTWAESQTADCVLTTFKDLVKIRQPSFGSRPLWAVQIGFEPLRGTPILEHHLWRIAAMAKQVTLN